MGWRWLRRPELFLVATLCASGCVIRYGEGPQAAAAPAETVVRPVDFAPIERQISALVESSESVDARDRIEVAWSLAQSMRNADPAAQHIVKAYLEQVIEIEGRAHPIATPLTTRVLSEGFGGDARVESDELAGPEPLQEVPPTRKGDVIDPEGGEAAAEAPVGPSEPDVAAVLSQAARLMDAKRPDEAIAVLEACKGVSCWSEVEPAWKEARDAVVFQRKESLAVRLLELRGEPEVSVQRAGLMEIQQELSALRAAWPGSAYQEEIGRHISRVQKELELLPEE